MTSLYMLAGYAYSQHLYELALENNALDSLWKFFLVLHISSWIGQFVGHGIFEKRAPALVDNLLLTLVAPFFVSAELLFMLGWNKEMFEEVEVEIKQKIHKFREAKKNKNK